MSYDKLTDKQKIFVHYYLIDYNATQAYLKAGYRVNNKTAAAASSTLLRNHKVKNAIKERQAEKIERIHVTQEMVINQLAKIAFADMKMFVEWDSEGNVTVKPAGEIDGTLIHEIVSTETENSRSFKFKRNDPLKALELLGKHLKLFTDKIEQQTTGDIKVNFNIPRPTYIKS